jgi:hypothetical protein
MSRNEWWRRLLASVDARQTQEFLSYLQPDAVFRYGSAPAAVGQIAIGTVVEKFLASFRATSHKIERTWEIQECTICQGEVTYVLLDGTEVTLPFCNVLSLAGEKVARYEIYIDPTPLMPRTA